MSIEYKETYNFWATNDYFDVQTKKELKEIEDNDTEIKERFYKNLEFGTAGLRGIIGAGTNRINVFTVRKASKGLANFVCKQGEDAKKRGIVIAYDSRFMSEAFAKEAARVFTANGIHTYLFDELRPVPELSFAVRHLGAEAGVVITASHNPKEYNGYKVYGSDGGQIPLDAAKIISKEIEDITDITTINVITVDEAKEKNLLTIIGKEVDDVYIGNLKTLSINPDIIKERPDFKIVYTPIHGTGNKPVRRILKEVGFENILVVPEQELPDCEFSTVASPNPENIEALELAINLAKKENVDLVIGTDPDCDRVGVAIRNKEGEYIGLTGNQIGCLLLDYILSQKKEKGILPKNGFAVKTIVSTELARKIANYFDIMLVETLTGFKFIGEKIKQLDEFGDKKYLFGFEESYGYLAGTFARDKDGVVSSMLIAEMAAYYNKNGMTLYEALQELYKKYGYYLEGVKAYTLKGIDGQDRIKFAMESLRNKNEDVLGNVKLKAKRDYIKGERFNFKTGEKEKLDLPVSNVLYYETVEDEWFCIRPSGTEPKIKVYFGVSSDNYIKSKDKLEKLKQNVLNEVESMLYN